MKNSFLPKILIRAFGLALGMTFLSCASPAHKPAPPSPSPPRFEAAAAPRETPPATHKSSSTLQEVSPAPRESAPIPPKTQPPSAPPSPTEVRSKDKEKFYHTVRWSGEMVSIIAAWYTGEPKNWKALAQANPDINPSRIYQGNKILIPEDLLKTRDPMPKEFVERFSSKSRKVNPQPKPQTTQSQEEPQLFGPKKLTKK